MNVGGGGCSETRLHHCTLVWVTRVKLHLKKKNDVKQKDIIVEPAVHPFTQSHSFQEPIDEIECLMY